MKFSRKIISGLKNLLSVKNKGCEKIRGMKFSNNRRNKGYKLDFTQAPRGECNYFAVGKEMGYVARILIYE